jgi:hypothetical protein
VNLVHPQALRLQPGGIIGAGGRVELKLAQPSIGAHGILMIRTICHGTGYRLLVKRLFYEIHQL